MKFPLHIEGYVVPAENQIPYKSDDFHFYYQVKCSCDAIWFHVQTSSKPNVIAICRSCGKRITVYDIPNYPAGVQSQKTSEVLEVQHPEGENVLKVFVMYEYGELDDDQEFDRNDISWCQVFVQNESETLVKIVDDETA